jgi:hypothetical protein
VRRLLLALQAIHRLVTQAVDMLIAALVQAGWTLRRSLLLDPISRWATQIELRRGRFIDTVAVARKLGGILFTLWRDGSR